MAGSYTTSPGLAAAKDVFEESKEALGTLAAGYGIAYPVGLLSKVLFMQFIPLLLKADMKKERALLCIPGMETEKMQYESKSHLLSGLTIVTAVILFGILVGSV